MRFAVVDGRVSFICTRMTQFSSSTSGNTASREEFSLLNRNGQLALSYERITDDETLKVSVTGAGDDVAITRSPNGKSAVTAVEFRQSPGKPITFSVGAGESKRTFSAPELWQLMIAHPKQCEEHLLPLLDLLRPDWKIAATAAEVEDKLIHGAGPEIVKQRTRWAKLVAQLGDDSFAKREAADRTLRAEGASAIGYLRQLDTRRLDAEQRFRIRRILESSVEDDKDDAAEDVAARLAGDPTVWLALLERPKLEYRKTAAAQLARLLGGPIGVDPAADPASQKQQRDRLRSRLLHSGG